jgi:hypothetical protein
MESAIIKYSLSCQCFLYVLRYTNIAVSRQRSLKLQGDYKITFHIYDFFFISRPVIEYVQILDFS